MEEFDCKKCLHEKVCALWASRESQNASCFCTDGCDYFTPTLTPPNEALTMEQLREMDGEPVWVQTPGIPKYGCWVIVAGVDTEYGQRTLYCQGDYTCRNYGRDWIAYRRPPEGEEDT